MRTLRICLIVIGSASLTSEKTFGCGGDWDVACNFGETVSTAAEDSAKTAKKAVDDTVSTGKKALDDAKKTGDKAADDVSNTAKKALDDTAETAKKAVDDSVESTKKAIGDAVRTYSKAANDLIDAGKAAERFIEHEIHDQGRTLTDAEKRLRQGKVVDAVWGIGADQAKHTNDNAAKAAQESEILNAVAQAAATTYGGPAGAAAYAAWYAYNATKDLGLALRAAAVAAISSETGTTVNAMPTGTVSEVIKKAAVTGAMGGVAVAASGGDANAVREGFVKAGAMVIVQSGQAYVKKEYGDPIEAKADSYCMAAVDASCKYVLPKLKHDATNAILQGPDGSPIVDTDYIVQAKKNVQDWEENAKGFDRIGNVKAIISEDKEWSVSFSKTNFVDKSANLPSIVLTYVGEGSILQEKRAAIQSVVDQSVPGIPAATTRAFETKAPLPSYTGEQRWAAYNDIATHERYFAHTNPNVKEDSVQIGDSLRAEADVGLYLRPAKWVVSPEVLKNDSIVIVSSIQTLSDKEGRSQKWIEIESSARSRGINDVIAVKKDHSVATASKDQERIWCIDQQLNAAFEIKSAGKIRPLLASIEGTVSKEKNGVLHVVLGKTTDNVISALFSDPTNYNLIVTKNGRLLQKVGPNTFAPAGLCTSVSNLGSP